MKLLEKFHQNRGFIKIVSLLASGTIFAQLINILVLPILTRLYTPKDFSLLAVYSSIISILVIIINLRFDIAIPNADSDNDARNLVNLSFIINFTLSLLLFLILLIIYFLGLNLGGLGGIILFIPVGVFFAGIFSALQYWVNREKNYKLLVNTKILQAISSNIVQLSGYILYLGAYGLVMGHISNMSAGLAKLYDFFKDDKKINFKKLKFIFIKYKQYVQYSLIEGVLSGLSLYLPIILLSHYLQGVLVGQLFLALKIMSIPMLLIGSSVTQIYLANAKDNRNIIYSYTLGIIKKISVLCFVPILLIGYLSQYFFPLFFGKEWSEAGNLMLYMVPWYIVQIVSSPVSTSLYIINKNKLLMVIHGFGFILRVLFLLIFANYNIENMLNYYFFSNFLFYFCFLFFILVVLKRDRYDCK